jgi:hypothetical protein
MSDLQSALQTICLNRRFINSILQTYYQSTTAHQNSTEFCFTFFYGSALGYGGPNKQCYTGAQIIQKFVNGYYDPTSASDLAFLEIIQNGNFYAQLFKNILQAKQYYTDGKDFCAIVSLPSGLFPSVVNRSATLCTQDFLNLFPYFAC